MPESALNVSATTADTSPVEGLETEAYLLTNKRSDATVKRSVRVSADPTDDASKIREAETTISREVDPTLATSKSAKSSIFKDPWTEQGAASNFIGDLTMSEEELYFVTGSSYKGSWDALGMAGIGRYVMPHGTVYEGEIRDGMFHGQGSLYWAKNRRLDVVHLRGKLQKYRYTFEDGLEYDETDWRYCKFPDRRFYESVKKGLRPGGRTLKTGKQPTKVLPSGCYDAGDGVFDPKTLRITSYDDSRKALRVPEKEEYDWIIKNCRKSWTEPTGYRPDLNENWSDDPPGLPYNLAMSKDSPDSWWQRLTTFKRQFETTDVEDDKDISTGTEDEKLPIPEICLCGQYVILGEPCHCATVPARSDDEFETEDVKDSLLSVGNSSTHSDVKSFAREKSKRVLLIGQKASQIQESTAGTLQDFTENLFTDEFVEKFDDHPNDVTKKENRNKVANEKSDEAIIYKLGTPIRETFLLDKAANGNSGEMMNEQDPPVEKNGEKVRSVTEPEAANGRGMMTERSKLLLKGAMTERDLPFDQTDGDSIRSTVIDTSLIHEIPQENNVTRSESNKTAEDVAGNVLLAEVNRIHSVSDNRQTLVSNVNEESAHVSILDELRRSLKALPSERKKPTDEKEIIEIYSKFSMKEKSRTKCANVWRLSGASREYDRRTKEDHLFESTLIQPSCELIEYARKPCVARVCKPTSPEVRTSASRCREEFPFNVPAKSSNLSADHNACRKQ